MLRVEGLTIAGSQALTFDVPNGRCVGLLGKDAAALRHVAECIGGIRLPAAGRVLIDDLDIQRDQDRARRRIAVGIARAAHALTSLGEHARTIAGTRPVRVTAAAGIARLGLDPDLRLTTPAARAAAALTAALLPDATVVVLHDPFRNLETDVRVKAIDWIRSLAESGASLFVTGTEERDVRGVSHSVIEFGAGR
jgi:ABC-type sugar transport system ATPase subunit